MQQTLALPLCYCHTFCQLLLSPHCSTPRVLASPTNLPVCFTISLMVYHTSAEIQFHHWSLLMLLQISKGNHIYLIRKVNYFFKPVFSSFQNQGQNSSSLGFSTQRTHRSKAGCNWVCTASCGLEADFREVHPTSAVWRIKSLIYIWIYSILTSKGLKLLVRGEKSYILKFSPK